ncbi:MAG: tetratricopeptide repeat protein [Candidatus Peregrinibacteria bacterium]|nr:tetratricopeptide repeat protein [Candidatus Peregrinibacteria bacterium]
MKVFERLSLRDIAILISVATFLVYAQHLGNAFVALDDGILITQNLAVQRFSWWSIKTAFTTYDPELYVPLTIVSYMLEHALFGLKPIVFHTTNLLLHIGSTVLILLTIHRLSGNRLLATLTALLFALHPLQVEAVVWASARKDVLSAFFFLASIYTYVLQRERGERTRYTVSVFAFLLALLSKVSVILLPLVLLLIDWYQGRKFTWPVLREKIPYFLLSVVFGLIAIYGKLGIVDALPLGTNALLALKSSVFYLQKILLPTGLTAIYPQSTPITLASLEFIIPLLIVLGMLIVALLLRNRMRAVSVAILFYFLMLAPSFTTFQKNRYIFFASDRYAYLAVIGMFLLIALFLTPMIQRSAIRSIRWSAGLVATILILTCASLTYAQGFTWKDSIALYENALEHYPESGMAANNLATVLAKMGRTQEAIAMYERAIAVDPRRMEPKINLARIELESGNVDRAIRDLTDVTAALNIQASVRPEEFAAFYFLGEAYEKAGDDAQAIAQFERAVERGPAFAEAHYNLGLAYQKRNRLEEAAEAYVQTIDLDPQYLPALYKLAGIRAEQGSVEEAEELLERVIALDPLYEQAARHLENLRSMETKP